MDSGNWAVCSGMHGAELPEAPKLPNQLIMMWPAPSTSSLDPISLHYLASYEHNFLGFEFSIQSLLETEFY